MASAIPAVSVRGQSTSATEKRSVRGFRRHAEGPKVADAVIEDQNPIQWHSEKRALFRPSHYLSTPQLQLTVNLRSAAFGGHFRQLLLDSLIRRLLVALL